MIFDVVEQAVDFLVVVLVVYLGCTRLHFDLKFALVIVPVNYSLPMQVMQLTVVSAVDATVVHVTLLFFVRIVFAVYYCYPYWLLNLDVNYVAVNQANSFVSLLVKFQ